uniref:Uncharacterized protein n=1 Tax=Helianthus annuus TaxID=4232 RepID=A0A251SJL2_HELAN
MVWLKTFKLSALGRQPEDVEYCIRVLCFVFCVYVLCFVLFCFVLFCFVLFCFVLFCFVCFVLFCFVLFCFVLFCFVLFCFVLFCFVLFCYYVSILADATIQVRGCLATSPLRYQRIQEMFMFLSDYCSCITTNTADLLIRSCLVLILCTFVYIHV